MMKVSLIVATFGSPEWQARGHAVVKDTAEQADEAFAYHMTDGTLAAVRNAAAARAIQDWLLFVDADDALAPGYVEAMRAAKIANTWPRPLLLAPAVAYVGAHMETPSAIPAWTAPLIEVNCAVIGTLIERRFFEKLGGFHDLVALEDWELWLRAVRAGALIVGVPDAIYRANESPFRYGGRNNDQSLYWKIREQYEGRFPWADTTSYKTGG